MGFPLVVLQVQPGPLSHGDPRRKRRGCRRRRRLELIRPFQDVAEFGGKVQPVLDLPNRQQEHRQAAIPQGPQRPQVPERNAVREGAGLGYPDDRRTGLQAAHPVLGELAAGPLHQRPSRQLGTGHLVLVGAPGEESAPGQRFHVLISQVTGPDYLPQPALFAGHDIALVQAAPHGHGTGCTVNAVSPWRSISARGTEPRPSVSATLARRQDRRPR